MILPSGFSTTDYSQSANARGWGAGWQTCEAINAGRMQQVTLAKSGTVIAGGMHATVAPLAEACFNAIEAVKAAARSVARLWRVMGWDADNVEWGSVQELKDTYAA